MKNQALKYHEVDTVNIPHEIAMELSPYLEQYGHLTYLHEIIYQLWYENLDYAKKIRFIHNDNIVQYPELDKFFINVFGCVRHHIFGCKMCYKKPSQVNISAIQ
jgi:hypothetical protein